MVWLIYGMDRLTSSWSWPHASGFISGWFLVYRIIATAVFNWGRVGITIASSACLMSHRTLIEPIS